LNTSGNPAAVVAARQVAFDVFDSLVFDPGLAAVDRRPDVGALIQQALDQHIADQTRGARNEHLFAFEKHCFAHFM
jgi:hypothetical protein